MSNRALKYRIEDEIDMRYQKIEEIHTKVKENQEANITSIHRRKEPNYPHPKMLKPVKMSTDIAQEMVLLNEIAGLKRALNIMEDSQ